MFYHPNDSKFTIILRHSAFWIALLSMFAMFLFFLGDEINIPQKQVVVEIDVKNRINICLPEGDDLAEESFFGF